MPQLNNAGVIGQSEVPCFPPASLVETCGHRHHAQAGCARHSSAAGQACQLIIYVHGPVREHVSALIGTGDFFHVCHLPPSTVYQKRKLLAPNTRKGHLDSRIRYSKRVSAGTLLTAPSGASTEGNDKAEFQRPQVLQSYCSTTMPLACLSPWFLCSV